MKSTIAKAIRRERWQEQLEKRVDIAALHTLRVRGLLYSPPAQRAGDQSIIDKEVDNMHPSTYDYLKPTDAQMKDMTEARQAARLYSEVLERTLPEGHRQNPHPSGSPS